MGLWFSIGKHKAVFKNWKDLQEVLPSKTATLTRYRDEEQNNEEPQDADGQQRDQPHPTPEASLLKC